MAFCDFFKVQEQPIRYWSDTPQNSRPFIGDQRLNQLRPLLDVQFE